MSIDELIAASTTDFHEKLKIQEVEQLFKYIAECVPCDIPYRMELYKTVKGTPDSKKKCVKDTTSISVSGTVQSGKHGYASFKLSTDDNNPLLFTSIKFDTIPGYTLMEHDETYRKVWNLVRGQVSNYFAERAARKMMKTS